MDENGTITLPTGEVLTKVDTFDFAKNPEFIKQIKDIQDSFIQKYSNNTIKQPDFSSIKNNIVEELQCSNIKLEQQTKELQSIHYENMKLNSQVSVLSQTIDSQLEEINDLKNINSNLKNELESAHNTIKKNNKHYWIYTILASLIVAIISYIAGLYSTEVKSLLELILQ